MKIEDEKNLKPLSSPGALVTVAVLMRNFSRTAGGAESYAVQLTAHLNHRYQITVFGQTFGQAIEGVTYVHVPYVKVLPRWLNQVWYALITWWHTRHKFDLVHSHENVWHGAVHTIHVKTVHASVLERRSTKGAFSTWLKTYTSPRMLTYLGMERCRLRPSRHVIFASSALKDETLGIFPRQHRNFVLAPGVSLPAQVMSQESRKQVRESIGLAPDCQVVLFVANDFKKKGLDTLLLAMGLLHQQGQRDLRLLVAGSGLPTALYRQLIDRLGIQDVVQFLGTKADMRPLYDISDCLAHPTTQDVFPMVVLEAMAHQLPVITSCSPWNSMADLLRSNQDALLISDPFDAQVLAAAILKCLTEKYLSSCLRANGLEFSKKYRWDHIALAQADIYEAARSH